MDIDRLCVIGLKMSCYIISEHLLGKKIDQDKFAYQVLVNNELTKTIEVSCTRGFIVSFLSGKQAQVFL